MMREDPALAAAVVAYLEDVEHGLAEHIIGDQRLLVDGEGTVHLASPGTAVVPEDIMACASSAGLPVGAWDGTDFLLGLQGAMLIGRGTRTGTVRVKERAGRRFLYGRAIRGEEVQWSHRNLGKGDACIVCDPAGRPLGIAEVVGSFKGRRPALEPLHELGTYLRDQN